MSRTLLLLLGLAACAGREPSTGAAPCAPDARPVPGPGGLHYRALAWITDAAPDTLWVEASATNWAGQRAELRWDAMALRVQAWRAPDRAGPPAWDTQRETDPATGRAVTYPSYARMDSLAPGVTVTHREWRRGVAVPVLRGDSLPAGTYHLAATLRLSGDSVRLPAGCVRLE